MSRLIGVLFALAAAAWALHPLYAHAKRYAVTGSREAAEEMLVCDKKADAVTFVQTMHDKGLEAAEAFFRSTKGCGIGAGTFLVGKVVYVAGVPKLGLAKVVEITTNDSKKYWITNISILQPGERVT